jgi:hypothetical protein
MTDPILEVSEAIQVKTSALALSEIDPAVRIIVPSLAIGKLTLAATHSAAI